MTMQRATDATGGKKPGACMYAGQYNEVVFKAIDYILDQMGQQGIRVIIAFIDYWKQTDGVQQARA